jgi:hypothetical protein
MAGGICLRVLKPLLYFFRPELHWLPRFYWCRLYCSSNAQEVTTKQKESGIVPAQPSAVGVGSLQ